MANGNFCFVRENPPATQNCILSTWRRIYHLSKMDNVSSVNSSIRTVLFLCIVGENLPSSEENVLVGFVTNLFEKDRVLASFMLGSTLAAAIALVCSYTMEASLKRTRKVSSLANDTGASGQVTLRLVTCGNRTNIRQHAIFNIRLTTYVIHTL